MIFRTIFRHIAVLLACLATPVGAAPMLWTLSNITFDDGGTAAGSFNFDASTQTISDYAISVSGGSTMSTFTYDGQDIDQFASPYSIKRVIFYDRDPTHNYLIRYLSFDFVQPLGDEGGIVSLFLANSRSFECDNCSARRYITGGQVVGQALAVPEPAGWCLMVLGFGMAGFALRRRQASRLLFAG